MPYQWRWTGWSSTLVIWFFSWNIRIRLNCSGIEGGSVLFRIVGVQHQILIFLAVNIPLYSWKSHFLINIKITVEMDASFLMNGFDFTQHIFKKKSFAQNNHWCHGGVTSAKWRSLVSSSRISLANLVASLSRSLIWGPLSSFVVYNSSLKVLFTPNKASFVWNWSQFLSKRFMPCIRNFVK